MAKLPGTRGSKAKKRATRGTISLKFGVATGKRRPPTEREVKWSPGPGRINLAKKKLFAKRLALDGFDDETIARIAGVSIEELQYLNALHPELRDAIETGRTMADAEVVAALFQNAVGYERTIEEVHGKDARVVRYKKWHPPELGAIKAWLRMRGNKRFKEAPAEIDVTSKGRRIGDGLNKESKADIINSIVAAVRPKPDNEPAKAKTKK